MTVVTANGAPTIRVARDERVEGDSISPATGLAILVAESIGLATMSDADSERAPCASNVAPNVAHGTIARQDGAIAEVIQKYQGQIVRTMGASIMAEFSDLAAAVHAGVAMQRLLESKQESSNGSRPRLRIGIHGVLGHRQDMDLFGEGAHAAASITKHAAPGQILASQKICDTLGTESDLHAQWFQKISIDGQNEDIFEVHWMTTVSGVPSRYQALFQVGAGGMGIVYKARDRETGDIVALKVLRSEIASDPAMQENLRREVRLARQVTHKNVCRIHEFNRSDGTACISMEFVEGASLQSMLQRTGPLPWNQALKIALQICAGLGEAHAQGIVHRDLKPANIMMDRGGVVKIMDFGIARPFQGTAQLTSTLIGTPAYMAPEQVELKGTDARTDVYALGLLLYEIVTGSQAFEGDTPIVVAIKQLREFPKRPRTIVPTLPAHADAVIVACLEKDPSKRFQSMDELATALNRSARDAQAKRAVALWGPFVNDMRRYRRDLHANVQPRIEAFSQFLRQQDWKLLTGKRAQRVLGAGLGAACFLGALVAFGMRNSRNRHAVDSASMEISTTVAAHGSQASASQTVAAGDADTRAAQEPATTSVGASPVGSAAPAWAHEVDLSLAADARSQEGSDSHIGSSTLGQPPVPAVSKSTAANNSQSKKTRQPIRISAPSSAMAKAATPKGSVQLPSAVSSPVPIASAAVSSEPSTQSEVSDLTSSNLSASHLPATSSDALAVAAAVEKPGDDTATQPARYFEVGSFKESTWADRAVEKLTQLGFHAVSVRKNLLWVQSYQVRVGPYTDATELDVARKNLVAQGFKPHSVK